MCVNVCPSMYLHVWVHVWVWVCIVSILWVHVVPCAQTFSAGGTKIPKHYSVALELLHTEQT